MIGPVLKSVGNAREALRGIRIRKRRASRDFDGRSADGRRAMEQELGPFHRKFAGGSSRDLPLAASAAGIEHFPIVPWMTNGSVVHLGRPDAAADRLAEGGPIRITLVIEAATWSRRRKPCPPLRSRVPQDARRSQAVVRVPRRSRSSRRWSGSPVPAGDTRQLLESR